MSTTVYVSTGGSAVHLMQGVGGAPHRISACGLHRLHGYLPDDLERVTTTKAVTCKRCRKTAVLRMIAREESE